MKAKLGLFEFGDENMISKSGRDENISFDVSKDQYLSAPHNSVCTHFWQNDKRP